MNTWPIKKIAHAGSHNRSEKARFDCEEMLENYDRGTSKDVYKIVTGDELQIYAHEPETKQHPTEDESNPTKVVRGRSTSKLLLACFFGKTSHVATVPLEHRRTVNPECYTTICFPKSSEKFEKEETNHCSP